MNHHELALSAQASYNPGNVIRLKHDVEFSLYGNVVAIRGSEFNWWDWARNLAPIPWKCGGIGYAPIGYAAAALRIAQYLFVKRPADIDYGAPVYVTGHSQGAAEAILVSELLHLAGWDIAECVGFGAARTGRRDLKVPTTIYDHAGDPVVKVPPLWPHPVKPVRLPDHSAGIKQHSINYYVTAMGVECG